ncbi:hypothetical protein [Nonomuraea rubra]|uniref:hypothetical protein n=1 Tax=Nonomuraea rubra TaxID=46180 RepID=UPI0031E7217F
MSGVEVDLASGAVTVTQRGAVDAALIDRRGGRGRLRAGRQGRAAAPQVSGSSCCGSGGCH